MGRKKNCYPIITKKEERKIELFFFLRLLPLLVDGDFFRAFRTSLLGPFRRTAMENSGKGSCVSTFKSSDTENRDTNAKIGTLFFCLRLCVWVILQTWDSPFFGFDLLAPSFALDDPTPSRLWSSSCFSLLRTQHLVSTQAHWRRKSSSRSLNDPQR